MARSSDPERRMSRGQIIEPRNRKTSLRSRFGVIGGLLLSYLDERRQALQLLVKGARSNDNWEMQQGEAMMRKSEDAARQVRELIAQTQ